MKQNEEEDSYEATEEDIAPKVMKKKSNKTTSSRVYNKLMKTAGG